MSIINVIISTFLRYLLLVAILIPNGISSISNKSEPSKYFIWVSNKAGLFSQLLQLKIAATFAERKCKRFVAIAPVKSTHFYNATVPINLCRIFQLPEQLICLDEKSISLMASSSLSACNTRMNITQLNSNSDMFVCYNGSIRSLLKNHSIRELMLKAVAMKFPSSYKQPNLSMRLFPRLIFSFASAVRDTLIMDKHGLNVNKTAVPLIVAHWRRGDQITTRCKRMEDRSVNCANASQFIAKVNLHINRLQLNHTNYLVYIATNEPANSPQYEVLHAAGMQTFLTVQAAMGRYAAFIEPRVRVPLERALRDSVSVLSIETALMLDADLFLGWGISEVNDVVEHTRKKEGKSFCKSTDRRQRSKHEQITWCSYMQRQRIKMQQTKN